MLDDIAARRLHAQGIACPRSTAVEEVVTRLGAIQAQDHPGALWSIGLRVVGGTRAAVEQAIVERTIVRTWPMRGTLHFVPAADARWMLALLTPRILKGAAGRHRQLELDDAAFRRSRALITKALTRDQILTRKALFAMLEKGGVPTTGQRGIHILQRLSMEGMLSHGPHAGKDPTFVLFDEWIRTSRQLERDDALRTIAHRFFTGHGPATLRDFIWWTGLTVADAKLGLHLAEPALERYAGDGAEAWMAGDQPTSLAADARAHLLPGFDEFLLGYRDRSAALSPAHAERVVPGANGVFLSTLVLDGRVRGTWRRKTVPNKVVLDITLFNRLSAQEKRAFMEPAERYARFLGVDVALTWGS